jgi:hypothetical protein
MFVRGAGRLGGGASSPRSFPISGFRGGGGASHDSDGSVDVARCRWLFIPPPDHKFSEAELKVLEIPPKRSRPTPTYLAMVTKIVDTLVRDEFPRVQQRIHTVAGLEDGVDRSAATQEKATKLWNKVAPVDSRVEPLTIEEEQLVTHVRFRCERI